MLEKIKEMTIWCLRNFRKKKIMILESYPDFTENTYFFYRYLVEEKGAQKDFKFVWFMNNMDKKKKTLCGVPIVCVPNLPSSAIQKIRRLYYFVSAKVIVDCNIVVDKFDDRQIRIFFDHGMPYKACDGYMKMIGKCDLLTTTSEIFNEYHKQFADEDAIKTVGTPKNEILAQGKENPEGKRFIVWMPTFRQSQFNDVQMGKKFPLGLPIIENQQQIEILKKRLEQYNLHLLFKLHPSQDPSLLTLENSEIIQVVNDRFLESRNLRMEEILAKSSALITDYSSVYFDYLFTKQPIALTLDDLKEYVEQSGELFMDPEKELASRKVYTFKDLLDFVEEIGTHQDVTYEERMEFMRKNKFVNLPASENAYQFILDRMN